jgi:hypothetical protein
VPYQVVIYPLIMGSVGLFATMPGIIIHTIFGMLLLTLLSATTRQHPAGTVQGRACGRWRLLAHLRA